MKKILAGLVIFAFLGVLALFVFGDDFEIEISESQVQSAINKRISAGPIKHLGVDIHLKSASVDFLASNMARLDVDFDASGFGYGGSVEGALDAGLSYRSPKLYFSDLVFQEFEMEMNTETNEKSKDIRNVARDFLKRQRDEMLTNEARESLDNLVTGEQAIVKEKTRQVVNWFVTTMPIYDLNNAGAKGSVASLALKDVRFTKESAIVTLSPRQAMAKVLTFCAIFLILVLYFLFVYSPGAIPWIASKLRVSESKQSDITNDNDE